MDKTKRKIELLNKIFDEEQRRAEVEKEAEALFIKGDFKKFNELLSSLDDSIILGLRAELAALDDEPEQQPDNTAAEQTKNAARYYDIEYGEEVKEDVIRKQYEWFKQQPWFNKTYDQFKKINFIEIKEESQQRQPQKNTEQENKKLINTLQQIIHETCEDICDNYCKYRDTTDEDYLCDIMRDGGDCPLDRIYV